MNKGRLEAFSDGVLAIILTIMVLELKVPRLSFMQARDLGSLLPLWPIFLSYILSFVYVGIYWNNHHHMLHATQRTTGTILWANMHLLFWLSLIPFVTGLIGVNRFAPMPLAMYGIVLLMSALAYWILQNAIIADEGPNSPLARAVGSDWKGKLSILLYLLAIGVAFKSQLLSGAIYILVTLVWLIPDRRIEKVMMQPRT